MIMILINNFERLFIFVNNYFINNPNCLIYLKLKTDWVPPIIFKMLSNDIQLKLGKVNENIRLEVSCHPKVFLKFCSEWQYFLYNGGPSNKSQQRTNSLKTSSSVKFTVLTYFGPFSKIVSPKKESRVFVSFLWKLACGCKHAIHYFW